MSFIKRSPETNIAKFAMGRGRNQENSFNDHKKKSAKRSSYFRQLTSWWWWEIINFANHRRKKIAILVSHKKIHEFYPWVVETNSEFRHFFAEKS